MPNLFLIAVLSTYLVGPTGIAMASSADPVEVSAKYESGDTKSLKVELGLRFVEKGFRVEKSTVKVVVFGTKILNNALPVGRQVPAAEGLKKIEVYDTAINWPVVLGRTDSTSSFDIAITYRACSDKICLAPTTKHLKINSTDGATVHASFFGSLESFWQLLTSIDASQVKVLAAQHMWLALILCFASGILTSLTPCVYPMIPITISIFGRMSNTSENTGKIFNTRTFGIAGFYVAGMCFTYSAMGLLAGLTGSLFGQVLQSSYMLAFLTLLFLTLALGQVGLFKIALPGSLQTKLSNVGHTRNILGVFIMGLFSGLIVSPCVGPVIAGILAFVFNGSNPLIGFLYFFSFSLGLGVLFLLIGGFSGVLSQLPRSGAWMLRVNRALALLLIIASGYYGLLWMKQMGWLARSIPVAAQNTEGKGIQWLAQESTAFHLAKERNQPVIIDFTAEWCEACHEIERTVFQDPKVIEKMKSFVALRLDFTEDNAETRSTGTKYGVISLPTIKFVTPDGTVMEPQRVNGVVSPEFFLTLLDSAVAGSSK